MDNIIKQKSFDLALRIVNLYKLLVDDRKEYVMSKQVLRSGTSVGANVREAIHGESRKDFIHKLAISQKEADETCYWLELLYASSYITEEEYNSIHDDAVEVLKILTKIIVSTKTK